MRVETTEVFRNWIDGLKDFVGRARIQARIERLAMGNPGHHRVLADGVSELKIDSGLGYRVYYCKRGNSLIILIAGGDKSSQVKDIRIATSLAKNL